MAFPTDTIYGIGGNPYFEQTVERIYEIKKRPRSQPLPLLLADKSDFVKMARMIPKEALLLLEHFLPGGLSLVLKKSSAVPDTITSGIDTVALRIPDHPVPKMLIRELGVPIVGTSANISGETSLTTAEEVHFHLGDKIDFIVDDGKCTGRIASTILDLTGEKPKILREGIVTKEEIERILKIFL